MFRVNAFSHVRSFSIAFYREEHIARKIELTVSDAKAKLAKGDKKGKGFPFVRPVLCLTVPHSTIISRALCHEKKEAVRGRNGQN